MHLKSDEEMLPFTQHDAHRNENAASDMFCPNAYLGRLLSLKQMDIDMASSQMIEILTNPSNVYKHASLRKQTRGHYARDDPTFAALLCAMIMLASTAYGVAFSVSFWRYMVLILHALLHLFGYGALVATLGWYLGNRFLLTRSTEQKIEWTFALDIHFNAFFPYFLVLYVVQFFLLPVLLLDTFLAAFLSNILYAVALSTYWYVTFLGYTSMPFLQNTEFYLYPLFPVLGFCGIASLVGFNLTLYFMNWFLY